MHGAIEAVVSRERDLTDVLDRIEKNPHRRTARRDV
ncbi:hypothetical protein LMG29739_02954 [Paraburkholderia solisilvae]|uniref:Uncharacterized protein n=2 Tax=Paraburkholderia solisilvae TaxID=624376 RepID=A0A6J5DY99_9BURK|nr:hypothetical protein LMG29739_02954 [Paraburkholderia solisilvae]